jgi:hypothetical protein
MDGIDGTEREVAVANCEPLAYQLNIILTELPTDFCTQNSTAALSTHHNPRHEPRSLGRPLHESLPPQSNLEPPCLHKRAFSYHTGKSGVRDSKSHRPRDMVISNAPPSRTRLIKRHIGQERDAASQ